MRQHRSPGQQDKTCPQWDCLGVESDKREICDRPLDDRDDTCATLLTTLCVSMTGVHIAKTTQKNKEKPSKSPEKYCKNGKAINMPKDDSWLDKKKGWKEFIRSCGVSSSVVDHRRKNKGRLQSLDSSQNFGGCCRRYHTWRHIGWI